MSLSLQYLSVPVSLWPCPPPDRDTPFASSGALGAPIYQHRPMPGHGKTAETGTRWLLDIHACVVCRVTNIEDTRSSVVVVDRRPGDRATRRARESLNVNSNAGVVALPRRPRGDDEQLEEGIKRGLDKDLGHSSLLQQHHLRRRPHWRIVAASPQHTLLLRGEGVTWLKFDPFT